MADPVSLLRRLREGNRVNIERILLKQVVACPKAPSGGAAAASKELEEEVYKLIVAKTGAGGRSTPSSSHSHSETRKALGEKTRCVFAALPQQRGPFPDDVLGVWLLTGQITAAEAAARATEADNENYARDAEDPRERIRRLFIKNMMQAPEFAAAREKALQIAVAMEASCYKAVIRTSRESEKPPRRHWDSQAFVDIYSGRCGTVALLLDPNSSVCREHGPTLTAGLFSGAIAPEAVGAMSEKDICPQATAKERAEIANRNSQHIVEQESNMFKCPQCGVRRCSYKSVQLRGADEAATFMCKCLNCGARFQGGS